MEIQRSQTVHSAPELFILLFDCLVTQACRTWRRECTADGGGVHGSWRGECTADGVGSARQMEEGVYGRWRRECTAVGGGSARQMEEGVHGRWRGECTAGGGGVHGTTTMTGIPGDSSQVSPRRLQRALRIKGMKY